MLTRIWYSRFLLETFGPGDGGRSSVRVKGLVSGHCTAGCVPQQRCTVP